MSVLCVYFLNYISVNPDFLDCQEQLFMITGGGGFYRFFFLPPMKLGLLDVHGSQRMIVT